MLFYAILRAFLSNGKLFYQQPLAISSMPALAKREVFADPEQQQVAQNFCHFKGRAGSYFSIYSRYLRFHVCESEGAVFFFQDFYILLKFPARNDAAQTDLLNIVRGNHNGHAICLSRRRNIEFLLFAGKVFALNCINNSDTM